MRYSLLFIFLFLLPSLKAPAQYRFLTDVPQAERLPALWRHCFQHYISDQDSITACRFLDGVARVADSLDDGVLKKYALYFRRCFRLLFSANYKQHFALGDFESPAAIFRQAGAWAQDNGYTDIAAACEHYQGEVYFYADQYGPAFDHLLKGNEAFAKLGYANVPGISIYLYDLGLNYYRFEEWGKALGYFLEASRHPFYLPRPQLSTINSIALIYARKKDWDKAADFYRETIALAEDYRDSAWIGIASGNLGSVFLEKGQADSALFYFRKDYNLNRQSPDARVDAALSAVAISKVFIAQHQVDSALFYLHSGQDLARTSISGTLENLEFRQRALTAYIELHKQQGNYRSALALSDSLMVVKDSLQQLLDAKILSRAVHKAEADRYNAELKFLETQKDLARFRFHMLIVVLLLLAAIAVLLFNRYRMRKRRQVEMVLLEKLRSEEKLKNAESLLNAYLATIKEKSTLIENQGAELQQLKSPIDSDKSVSTTATNVEKLFSSTLLTEEDWQHFRNLFEQVHPGFSFRLREKVPGLSPAETRLVILIKLNLSSREMAGMLGISMESIRKARYRLRKKLNGEDDRSLETIIQKI